MKISGAKTLATDVVTEKDMFGRRGKLIIVGSRGKNQIAKVYGRAELPVLHKEHPLSELYLWTAHEKDHKGTLLTLRRSRRKVWIICGRPQAETIRMSCTKFRLKENKCIEQRMGPMLDHRVGPGPIFQSVGVDLFGPIQFQGIINKRQAGKGWGVMFVCTATLAVYVEFMDTYSTNSFLMALH